MIRPWRLVMAPNMRLGNGNEGRGAGLPGKSNHTGTSNPRPFFDSERQQPRRRFLLRALRSDRAPIGVRDPDKWANVARSFAHQPEKDSAIALSGRVRKLRQGGIQVFQKALLPAQPGQRVGNASSQAPEVAQRQKIEVGQAMMQVIQRGVDQTVDVYRQVAHQVVQRVRPAIQQAPRPEHHGPRIADVNNTWG
jgi:hypothetical protein